MEIRFPFRGTNYFHFSILLAHNTRNIDSREFGIASQISLLRSIKALFRKKRFFNTIFFQFLSLESHWRCFFNRRPSNNFYLLMTMTHDFKSRAALVNSTLHILKCKSNRFFRTHTYIHNTHMTTGKERKNKRRTI